MIQLQLMGSEPLFVVKFSEPAIKKSDPPVTLALFSTQELATDECQGVTAFDGKNVLSYVESFGQFSTVQEIKGFGSVQSISVVFNDTMGYFKKLLETKHLYDLYADLYLFIKQPNKKKGRDQPTCVRLFSGKVGGPISWTEGSRQLELNLVSGIIYKEFGYVPEFLGVQGIELNLNTQPWPHIFGEITNFGLTPFCNIPIAHLDYNLHILRYMPARRVQPQTGDPIDIPEGFPDYPNTDFDKYVKNDVEPIITLRTIEQNILPAEVGEYYSIDIAGGSVLFQATVVNDLVQIIKWNVPWYTDLVAWSPPQYNAMLPYRNDDSAYSANIIVLLGYQDTGIIIPEPGDWQFNIYDELIPPTNVKVMFPIDSGIAIGAPGWWSEITNWQNGLNMPWLKDMFIRFLAVEVYRDTDNEPAARTCELWAKVVDQEGCNLYVDEIRTLEDKDWTLNGLRVIYIYEATKNKIFYPNSYTLRPRPAIVAQKTQENTEKYLDHRYTNVVDPEKYFGVFDLAFTIPQGAEIKAVGWWATLMYPVSLDLKTYYVEVYIKSGRRLIQLDMRSQYAIMRYEKYEDAEHTIEKSAPYEWYRPDMTTDFTDPTKASWMSGVTHDTSPLPESMEDPVIRKNWPDEFTFIILNKGTYLQMLKDMSGVDPLTSLVIYARNEIDTDERVFEFLINKYTSFTPIVNSDIYRHHPSNFGVHESDTSGVTGFISNLAFEHAKQVRIKVDQNSARQVNINLQDLLDLNRTLAFTFEEKYIDARSLDIQYANDENIYNYIRATAAEGWASGTLVLRNAASIARYTERIYDHAILTNRVYDTYPNPSPPDIDPGDPANTNWTSGDLDYYARGYNRVLYFWLYTWAKTWQHILFTSYLDAAELVGGDYTELKLSQALEFKDKSEVGVLRFPEAGDGNERLPKGKGIILETTIDPKDWTLSIHIQLPTELGDERE